MGIVLTRFTKVGGPLTKEISISNGMLKSDGSKCVMGRGHAQRVRLDNLGQLGELMTSVKSNQALGLGRLRDNLPDCVRIMTKAAAAKLNGSVPPNTITRTAEAIDYTPGEAAIALIDFDQKGMPPGVRARVAAAGGCEGVLTTIAPELVTCGRVVRTSTSAGIYRTDTGEAMLGSGGLHILPLVQDGGDVERFLRTLHERCWAAGCGWYIVGAAGQLLERSLVDKMVYAPERLVFEGPPILIAPLAQDQAARQPRVFDGPPLDTKAACPPLRISELTEIAKLKAQAAHALAPQRARARDKFISQQADQLASRSGISNQEARRVIARQCVGVLLPDVRLPWDDPEFDGCSVGDILKVPERFVGATLADPLDGSAYGRCKAIVMRRPDGQPWIKSFAHGHITYELRYDARAADAALAKASKFEASHVFVAIALASDLDPAELEELRNEASALSGITKRALDAKLKAAKQKQASQHARAERERKAAERRDPRPAIPAPPPDAPWIPQMEVLNDILGASKATEPPMRDVEGVVTEVRVRYVPSMHAVTANSANGEETDATIQPPPIQPLLTRLTEMALAEMIERHIDYVHPETGGSVHLSAPFVKHYHTRTTDDALPTVTAIATLPLVMTNGALLSQSGLDRQRGIVFRVPSHIQAMIPKPEECTPTAIAEAMAFLIDEFLCDVACNYACKCVLLAFALTIIERSLLADRPAFFVTAGRRGGGKTTVLMMLLVALTGVRPSAAAWSPNEEERRKALLAYFLEGVPVIIWDNIPRGTAISCPHIEKSCTTEFYSDRRLGVTETITVSAATVHAFTGNNIGPKGDLASRSLQAKLDVDRADPENRPFKHPDPIGWTEAHRCQILRALYTILLGNPAIQPGSSAEAPTRFKTWWCIVGSAVENAAFQHMTAVNEQVAALVIDQPDRPPQEISFRDLFLAQEEDDEDNATLADILAGMAAKWPAGTLFKAADVADVLNQAGNQYAQSASNTLAADLREFLYPKGDCPSPVNGKSIGKRLKKHAGDPVRHGDRTLILKEQIDRKGVTDFFVVSKTS